ncbi:MAG TPA: hypothetical protein VFU88_13620 [Ktedonobacterales bacterium]|nr:hypothetical protein [Ktedonobacterales bacterium]
MEKEAVTTGQRTLYRPVGLLEMVHILEADSRAFPPRQRYQPIFYPVLVRAYADQIARDWNAPSERAGYAGFVTEFQVDAAYVARFEEHVVGAAVHRELWVPAEELDEFNRHLAGPIALVGAYYGDEYAGPEPLPAALKGRTAREQLPVLAGMLEAVPLDFRGAVGTQPILVQLNFAYWVRRDVSQEGLAPERKVATLRAIRAMLLERLPDLRLFGSTELDAAGQ